MFEAQRSVLVKFVRKCRRYFPPGTATEVWEQFKGPLASPLQPAAFEVPLAHPLRVDDDFKQLPLTARFKTVSRNSRRTNLAC